MRNAVIAIKRNRRRAAALALALVLAVGAVAGIAVRNAFGPAWAGRVPRREIASLEDFERFLVDPASGDYDPAGSYLLTADLNLSALSASVGSEYEPFTGAFDGGGHTLSGLARPLFGVVNGNATLENLLLDGAVVTEPVVYGNEETGYTEGYAILAAYAGNAVIRNCGVVGEVFAAPPTERPLEVAPEGPATPPAPPTTAEPTPTPGPEVTATPGPEATATPGPEITATPGPEITATPGPEITATPGPEATATPGPEATATPGPEVTATPGPEITATPGPEVTETPGPEVTATPGPEAAETPCPEAAATPCPEATETPAPGEIEVPQEQPPLAATPLSLGERAQPQGYGAETLSHTSLAAPPQERRPAAEPESPETSQTPPDFDMLTPAPQATEEPAVSGEPQAPSAEEPAAPEPTAPPPTPPDFIRDVQPVERNYIQVTAGQVAVGGLVAQAGPGAEITDCFSFVTLSAGQEEGREAEILVPDYALPEPPEASPSLFPAPETIPGQAPAQPPGDAYYLISGGFAALVDADAVIQNCCATGLVDAAGLSAGFAAVNRGHLGGCFSTVVLSGTEGVKSAFTAAVPEPGTMALCAYDRQMACAEDPNAQGMDTGDMTGAAAALPGGSWYLTDNAYPQLSWFAGHESPALAQASKAGAIALVLPEGAGLLDAIGGAIPLPRAIDEEPIQWQGEGDVTITADNQAILGAAPPAAEAPPPAEEPLPANFSLRRAGGPEGAGGEENGTPLPENTQSAPAGEKALSASLTATMGELSKTFSLRARAGTYANWQAVGAASPQPAAGDGTAAAPYQLASAEDLAWFMNRVNGGNSGLCATVTQDIDLTGTAYGGAEAAPLPWVPIGRFDGTFDGGNHIIRKVYVNMTGVPQGTSVGFFGVVAGNNGLVKNVLLSDIYVQGTSSGYVQVGGLAGQMSGTPTIERCGVLSGSVSGTTAVANMVGGLVGDVHDGKKMIRDCFAMTTGSSGGLVGRVWGTLSLSNCYFAGSASQALVNNRGVGSRGQITSTNNYYKSGVSNSTAGGTALTEAQMQSPALVNRLNAGRYGDSAVWFLDGAAPANGGYPAFTQNVSDWQAVGAVSAPAALDAANGGYQLATAEDLAWFMSQVNSNAGNVKNPASTVGVAAADHAAKLTADIDLAGKNWVPIARDVNYVGAFNGDRHTVSNLTSTIGGLFGTLNKATVTSVGIESGSIVVAGGAGGIAEFVRNSSVIERCYNKAGVQSTGNGVVSGIAGTTWHSERARISDCFNLGSIRSSAQGSAAGIAGLGDYTTTIQNCYNMGNISAGAGGTMGAIIARVGLNVSPANCWYDSTKVTGDGAVTNRGTALTEAQMKSPALVNRLNGAGRYGDGAVWFLDGAAPANGGYPAFTKNVSDWQAVGAISAPAALDAANGGYQLASAENLAWFMSQVNSNGGSVKNPAATVGTAAADQNAGLTADVDLAGKNWGGIGSGADYVGTFDGGGHTVANLTGDSGVFGTVSGGTVKRLGVVSGTLSKTTPVWDVGGIANAAVERAVLQECYNLASITYTGGGASAHLGGIAGLTRTCTIQDCYNLGAISSNAGSGSTVIGGIAGYAGYGDKANAGMTVKNCYNAGAISGTASYKAAIAARNAGGAKITMTNCCYDNQTSGGGLYTGSGVTGLATAAMKEPSTVLFLNGSRTGADRAWGVDREAANGGYPILSPTVYANWAEVGAETAQPAGSGAADDPWRITKPEELGWLAYQVNSGRLTAGNNQCARLELAGGAALDLTGADYRASGVTTSLPWQPLGYPSANPYRGEFDGMGHEAANLYVSLPESGLGLFGTVGEAAVVKNMGVGGTVTGTGGARYVGGVVGFISGGNVRVEGCWNKADVTGPDSFVGGVAGGADSSAPSGVVSGCWNAGTVRQTGGSDCGGVIGSVRGNAYTIETCYNLGAVSANQFGGGILGNQPSGRDSQITDCYNAGGVTVRSGADAAAITPVALSEFVGVANCYYDSQTSGAAGRGTGATTAQMKSWGAAFALNGGSLTGAWATDEAAANGGYPVFGSLRAAGSWPEVGEWRDITGQGPLTAVDTANHTDYYSLTSAEDLAWYAYKHSAGGAATQNLRLFGNDVDLFGRAYTGVADTVTDPAQALAWVPIGGADKPYAGSFDGRKRTIHNLRIDGPALEVQGLFGAVSGGTVQNVRLSGVQISVKSTAGAVAGQIDGGGQIKGCSVLSGRVHAAGDYAGGIAGRAENAVIQECGSLAAVDSDNSAVTEDAHGKAGGIVGRLGPSCKIYDCYNGGAIGGRGEYTGGIYGWSQGTGTAAPGVYNCYNYGSITNRYSAHVMGVTPSGQSAVMENCYYDSTVKADNVGASGAAGLTAAEMKTRDFAEALNTAGRVGPDSVWTLDDAAVPANGGYPVFGQLAVILRAVVPTSFSFYVVPEVTVDGPEDLQTSTINPSAQYRTVENLSDAPIRLTVSKVEASSADQSFRLVPSVADLSRNGSVIMAVLPVDTKLSSLDDFAAKALTTASTNVPILDSLGPQASKELTIYAAAKAGGEDTYFDFTVTPTIKIELVPGNGG